MYDIIIVGGGPAGVAAGVYAARKKLRTAVITDTFGGQSLVSTDIQNWIGTKSVSGFDLAKMLEEHLRAQVDVGILDNDLVKSVRKNSSYFEVTTEKGKVLESRKLLITTGSRYKKLNIPGENKFEGKGVSNCSVCDAPIFGGKDVAVIGGGNSGLEAVMDFLPYANKIYLLHRGEFLKGDPVTQDKIRSSPKVEIILNAETQEIIGKDFIEALRYKNKKENGKMAEIKVEGVFVKIGLVPSSDLVKNLVNLTKWGEIIVDFQTQRTSFDGIWAAGDVTNGLYKQNNVSVGDAIKAVLNIHDSLKFTR